MLNRFLRVNLCLWWFSSTHSIFSAAKSSFFFTFFFFFFFFLFSFLQEAANGIGVCAEYAQSNFKTIAEGAFLVLLNVHQELLHY
jgi:hypothetical protein